MTSTTLGVLSTAQPAIARHTPTRRTAKDWAWVTAAPFRAHVRHVLALHPLPWRAFAGYARVPDNVVRGLLGVGRRPLRRLAPHYAQALLAVRPDALGHDLTRPVDADASTLAAQALRSAGWSAERIASVGDLAESMVPRLMDGRLLLVTLETDLLLAAAARAHGLEPAAVAPLLDQLAA